METVDQQEIQGILQQSQVSETDTSKEWKNIHTIRERKLRHFWDFQEWKTSGTGAKKVEHMDYGSSKFWLENRLEFLRKSGTSGSEKDAAKSDTSGNSGFEEETGKYEDSGNSRSGRETCNSDSSGTSRSGEESRTS